MLRAPAPRSRLYTSFHSYAKGVQAFVPRRRRGTGVQRMEDALAKRHGRLAVAVPMARVGIYLALKNLIRPGQKVILSPYTISDVVNMVICAGGVPLFADIERGGSFNLDADEVSALLSENHDVGAVLVTHFYGLACDIEKIMAACDHAGVPVVEDAAQATGTRVGGRLVGTFGRAGVFSFGLLKSVTSFLGGAVITEDVALATAIRADVASFSDGAGRMLLSKMMKGLSFDVATHPVVFDTAVYWMFRHAYLNGKPFFGNKLDTDSRPVARTTLPDGYAHRMTDAQADLVRAGLRSTDDLLALRIEHARQYHAGLNDLPDLVLPPLRTDGSHGYFYFPIQYADRERLVQSMTRDLRDVQISHHRNCADMECFAAFQRDCPNARQAERSVIYLPTYPGYGRDQVEANVQAIRSFLRSGNA